MLIFCGILWYSLAMDKLESPEVYKSISNAMIALGKTGIAKSSTNQSQKYQFRGIDAVYENLNGILSDEKLLILPRVVDHQYTEFKSNSGGRMVDVLLDVEFDIVSAKDGSIHTVRTTGEAMDSADKAANKAMSAAYKYMAIMTFCIPVEGDDDADATTPSVASKQAPQTQPTPKTASADERKRNAGLYLSRNISPRMTPATEEFKTFKAACEENKMSWVDVVLEFEAKEGTTYSQLMMFLNGEWPNSGLSGFALNAEAQEVFNGS